MKRKLEQGHFQKLAKENMTSIAFKYHHSVGYWSLTRKADKGRSGVVTGKKLDQCVVFALSPFLRLMVDH